LATPMWASRVGVGAFERRTLVRIPNRESFRLAADHDAGFHRAALSSQLSAISASKSINHWAICGSANGVRLRWWWPGGDARRSTGYFRACAWCRWLPGLARGLLLRIFRTRREAVEFVAERLSSGTLSMTPTSARRACILGRWRTGKSRSTSASARSEGGGCERARVSCGQAAEEHGGD